MFYSGSNSSSTTSTAVFKVRYCYDMDKLVTIKCPGLNVPQMSDQNMFLLSQCGWLNSAAVTFILYQAQKICLDPNIKLWWGDQFRLESGGIPLFSCCPDWKFLKVETLKVSTVQMVLGAPYTAVIGIYLKVLLRIYLRVYSCHVCGCLCAWASCILTILVWPAWTGSENFILMQTCGR